MLCNTCDRPMRSHRQTLADHPGTVVHAAHGDCKPCYDLKRRLASEPTGQELWERLPGHIRAYLTERRRRLQAA